MMSFAMPTRKSDSGRSASGKRLVESRLRVIGGKLRGRTIPYDGDTGLRPMKERVREAVFNLVGPRVVGKHVMDLFAGTGAMSFESISRGAASATVFERRFPTIKLIESAAAEFGISNQITVSPGDTFIWAKKVTQTPQIPWLIFCCPPYELYVSRRDDLFELIHGLWNSALENSVLVIESDERFNPEELLPESIWDTRRYLPAIIGITQKLSEPNSH
jgi:16S rRNA (guanine966-N2)-methyltransferase